MSNDMLIALVFRAACVPAGVQPADMARYLGHVIEDRDGSPAPEVCAAMHRVKGQLLGHFLLPDGPAAQDPAASRLTVKGPRSHMKEILGRYIEAGSLVDGAVPVRPAMLKRTTLPVRLLLALHAAGVSLPWLLSGEGDPLRDASRARVEGTVNMILRRLEALEAAVAEAQRVSRMTLDDLVQAKSADLTELAEARREVQALRAQLRDVSAELAAHEFSM
ncbi:hypothetical protein SAMN04488503_2986 [Humidesulfovibrio mexicanus]|uniref:Uncharacterized protein n=1 Tax=Humidesulfovibrio mexicanus TaxID=147047 RepID=A0A239C6M1_9BACT|nr:hypothetical protein [Humidesulfovibrio mexicanus]SNS15915.1 hypothetical protein SAMN04488503_2986 [Humidesulfovibrio mexicanus]